MTIPSDDGDVGPVPGRPTHRIAGWTEVLPLEELVVIPGKEPGHSLPIETLQQ